MKKVRNFIFIFSILTFLGSEISVNCAGDVTNLTSENKAEPEAQPHTLLFTSSTKSKKQKSLYTRKTEHPVHFGLVSLKTTSGQSVITTNRLFLIHRKLLI